MKRVVPAPLAKVVKFYSDGFREMTIGRKLWVLIIIKVIVIFGVLKIFFFPDVLKSGYDDDNARAEAVRGSLGLDIPTAVAHDPDRASRSVASDIGIITDNISDISNTSRAVADTGNEADTQMAAKQNKNSTNLF